MQGRVPQVTVVCKGDRVAVDRACSDKQHIRQSAGDIMGLVGVGGEVDGSSNKIGAGFCGVIDFDHEVVVGVVVLEIRIVWIELLVHDHVDTAPTRYVAAFGEGGVGAGGSWWGAGGAWREAVPACIFAVVTPAAAEA